MAKSIEQAISKAQRNEETEVCVTCQRTLEPGQALRATQWDRWVCEDDFVRQEEAKLAARESATRAHRILMGLIASCEKLGDVVSIQSGESAWQQTIKVRRDGFTFDVSVRETTE